jgi:hypothetical protein
MRNSKTRAAAAALGIVLALASAPAPASARSAGAEAGLGVAVVLGNMVYGPAKMMYAAFGGFFGLIAYGLSAGDEDVALRIIEPAWRGDYLVTMDHLDGKKELEFIGRREAHRDARGVASGPDEGGSGDGGESGWE